MNALGRFDRTRQTMVYRFGKLSVASLLISISVLGLAPAQGWGTSGGEKPETAEGREATGYTSTWEELMDRGERAFRRGDDEEALDWYGKALDMAVAQEKISEELIKTLTAIGTVYYFQNDLPRAEYLWRLAVRNGMEIYQPDSLQLADLMHVFMRALRKQARHAETEPLMIRILEIRQSKLPANHADVAISLLDLAVLYERTGRSAQAIPLRSQALRIRELLRSGAGQPSPAVSPDQVHPDGQRREPTDAPDTTSAGQPSPAVSPDQVHPDGQRREPTDAPDTTSSGSNGIMPVSPDDKLIAD